MKKIYLIILTGFLALACGRNEAQFEQILRLADRRVACDSLVGYLSDPEPRVRARAVAAIGKLQDKNCTAAVTEMLDDLNHNVRLEAAFALGQIGDSLAENSLTSHLAAKERIDVKVRIVAALGKIATVATFPTLIKLFKHEDAALRGEAALALARMALRKLTQKMATDAVAACLKDGSAEVRWKAAYALMRIRKDVDAEILISALADKEPRVRMYAARALGQSEELKAAEKIGQLLAQDPNWRVRVTAANALSNFPLKLMANYYALLGQNAHVKMAIIRAIGSSAAKEEGVFQKNSKEHNSVKKQLEQLFEMNDAGEQRPPAEIGAALISYAKLLREDAIDSILQFKDHANHRLRARAIEALAETGSGTVKNIYEQQFPHAVKVVKMAILEKSPDLQRSVNPQIYAQALAENDPVLVALAAQALSKDSLRNKIYAPRITEAYQKLAKPIDTEVAQMIFSALAKFKEQSAIPILQEALTTSDKAMSKAAAGALQKITGDDYSAQIAATKSQADFKYSEIADLQGAKAFIKTARGDIEIELFTNDAPLTVLNFVRLAEKGFFDRLRFHRVVPNFVIQGGDPRGDSWGSPGYAIRSEFNQRPYLRGTVGMASAGKDTEGCQFFITHSPQPHLDSHYTVFGQVISGMDVVDAIQEDDEMELIAIKR